LRKGKLEHEFEVALSLDDRAALEAYIETLPPESPSIANNAKARRTTKTSP
jgi:hypothetical protein